MGSRVQLCLKVVVRGLHVAFIPIQGREDLVNRFSGHAGLDEDIYSHLIMAECGCLFDDGLYVGWISDDVDLFAHDNETKDVRILPK